MSRQQLAADVSARRLLDATDTADQLLATGDTRPDLGRDRVRDVIWALNSPEIHQLLTVDRGWSLDDYQDWLAHALIDALIAKPEPDDTARPTA